MDEPECLQSFAEPVRRWFVEELGHPTRVQQLAWPAIRMGRHTLVVAPTGSGKTLAAFLVAIDHLLFDRVPPPEERCRVVYVSPLKALAVDIERNLRRPIAGISAIARQMGTTVHVPEVAVRTGDTPGRERRRFSRRPADILVTTPESLYLVLTSSARQALRSVRWVIVDEIHAVVGTKRGTHLALSLERLVELTQAGGSHGMQRIGLSATVRPLDEVARFLGGFDERGAERPVRIVDAGAWKELILTVAAPQRSGLALQRLTADTGGVWPAMHETLLEHIRQHRSTLIFVNNRRLAERLAAALNELAGRDIAQAHHGSIARERRLQIEDDLKSGKLPALVATSSLELGIDMGAVDLVVQIESPPSIASALQRIGRAGHHVDTPSVGVILPKHRGDLLACAAVTERMRAGAVESMRYPRNPLDVLAQQIVAMVAMDPLTADDVERIVRRAAPYQQLPRHLLEDVLDMLSGRYPSHEFSDLRPRLFWNKEDGALLARENARRVAVGSGGTIPDRGQYGVFISGVPPSQGRVGELEEIMVFESRVGDVFLLGASSWRIAEITPDRVLVTPAPGVPGRMPFWHGEGPGRPAEFGRAIGALARELLSVSHLDALALLAERHGLTEAAANDLMDYLHSQQQAAGAVPDDRTILVERHRDEMGEWRVCILTPLGSRVLAPWAMAIGAVLRERTGIEADILWTEDGLILRLPDAEAPPATEWLFLDPDDVERVVVQQLAFGGGAARRMSHGAPVTAVFASHFREAAARALLLPHRHSGRRSPLWLSRKRAADLLHVVSRYRDFPIVLETFRECLQDVFDIPSLVELMEQVQDGRTRVIVSDTAVPSPFAASLLFSYTANFMYEGDAPLAERRAQALAIDPIRLRQLLGEADLRDLLEPRALAEVEASLQSLTDSGRAKSADDLHDMLLRLGDLSFEEIAARSIGTSNGTLEDGKPPCVAWLQQLLTDHRVVRFTLANQERYIAVEDALRYRDALGANIAELQSTALNKTHDDPLGDLLARFARTRGPFTTGEAARRFGLGTAVVQEVLGRLESQGRVVQGEFRPSGAGPEWCDVGVLKTLRSRSLAILRRDVEPVEQTVLARFLTEWHGITPATEHRTTGLSLTDVLRRLQGYPLPASHLERHILPPRLASYDRRDLDLLVASGEVVWTGDGKLGPNDGRVRLFLASDAPYLLHSPAGSGSDPAALQGLAADVYAFLSHNGASFFPAIANGVHALPSEVLEALWDLVWMGLATNDTLQPLRSLVDPTAARRAEAYSRRRAGRFRPLPVGPSLGGRPVPPTASGRWSVLHPSATANGTATDRLMMWAEQLLERYGILTREAVLAEGMEGGFASLYPVLSALEEAGRVRRGYFVEGLGASQFALPDAIERLRQLRSGPSSASSTDAPRDTVFLAAADPANPYGASLDWPSDPDPRRPARAAGAFVILLEGELCAWLSPGERRMLLFREDRQAMDAVLGTMRAALQDGRLVPFILARINGVAAADSALLSWFEASGFSAGSRGIVLRRPTNM